MKRLFSLAGALSLMACPAPPVEPDPEIPVEGPLFVITTQVFGAEGTTTFMAVSPTLEEGSLDLADAVELPGRALVTGIPGQDTVFVADGEAPTIRRFRLSPGGTLTEDAQLSFAGVGVTSLLAFPGQFQYISETKAYYFDDATAQIVVWNPAEMILLGTIPLLDLIDLPGAAISFEIDPTRRGDQLIVTLAYASLDFSTILPETRVLFVDTATDAVEAASVTGCGDVLNSVSAANGDIFLSTEGFGAALHRVGGEAAAPAPCLLRIPAGENTIENALAGSLNDLAGAPAGSLTAGSNGESFILVLDEASVPPEAFEDAILLRGGPFWRWQPLALDSLTVGEPVSGVPPVTASSFSFPVEEQNFLLLIEADFSATTLVQLSSAGATFGLEMPGVPFGLVRAR